MGGFNQELVNGLHTLAGKYLDSFVKKNKHLPLIEKDDDWISICEQGEHDENFNYWQPSYIKNNELTFENVESALEITLHIDIKTYFTAMYSDHLNVKCNEGDLALLFAWNDKDFERLQENMIGHILMKQKLKQTVTLFFAITDDEDYILSVNNDNGEVWVERIGCEPHKKVASSLSEFLDQLTPIVE